MKTQKLNKQFLIKEFNTAISDAEKSLIRSNDFKKSIAFCQYAGYLAWMYPFRKNFSNDKLEIIISQIAEKFNPIEYIPQDKKIVFYNSQIIDNVALTEQYLEFFIKNEYQILLIIPDIKNTHLGKNILEKIDDASNVKLFISEKENNIDKIIEIRRQINLFQAKHCFLHFVPNDVIGCISFLNIAFIKTYYIVHNDHTFWIGKNFFDYFIEFRKIGITLAIDRRGIPLDKILHIPFYPLKNEEPFTGFPFERKNKIIGISGAHLYKYLFDPALRYFHVLKELIIENPDFIFCLCGKGDSQLINQFIVSHNLQDRFFLLGYRPDFYNLVGQSDILFESYPLKGGLVPLFATEQKIPVVGIATYNNCSGSLEDNINIEGYQQPTNFKEFKAEANKLIRNTNYRFDLGTLLSKNRCNKHNFEMALEQVLKGNLDEFKPKTIKEFELNNEAFLQEYLNLSDATIENLMLSKLFILKTSLPLICRLRYLPLALKTSYTKGIYKVLRITFLVFFGR